MKRGILILAGVLALAGWDISGHYLGWRFALGDWPVPPGTPWTYQLWSGFIAALSVITVFTAVLAAWRHVNCHVHRCPGLGRYPVAGGAYRVCRRHHPEPEVRAGLRPHHVAAAHRAHLGRPE